MEAGVLTGDEAAAFGSGAFPAAKGTAATAFGNLSAGVLVAEAIFGIDVELASGVKTGFCTGGEWQGILCFSFFCKAACTNANWACKSAYFFCISSISKS
jgi:hypothetical protein